MRQEPTSAEAKLWRALRMKQVGGQKWRRQVPMGSYIVDFYCAELRLIVEVDGATHADPASDTARNTWLYSQGHRILRFWNNEVLGDLSGVLKQIAATPSTKGGGETHDRA